MECEQDADLPRGEDQVAAPLDGVEDELADAIGVDRNTVLAAYRTLRDDGLLEFRRGRGARVAEAGLRRAELDAAGRELVQLARRHGYGRAELITMIEELT